MLIAPGTIVRVLPPFSEAFPEPRKVDRLESVGGSTVVYLEGVESAFDPSFLEVVA